MVGNLKHNGRSAQELVKNTFDLGNIEKKSNNGLTKAMKVIIEDANVPINGVEESENDTQIIDWLMLVFKTVRWEKLSEGEMTLLKNMAVY